MKTALIILILLHGALHTLGFLKAYKLVGTQQLTKSISKPRGILWLLAAALFTSAAILFAFSQEWWWLLSCAAIIISQRLIIDDWKDAKFGTILNVIIFVATTIGFVTWWLSRH